MSNLSLRDLTGEAFRNHSVLLRGRQKKERDKERKKSGKERRSLWQH